MSLPATGISPAEGPDDVSVAKLYEAHADFVWRTLQRFGVHPGELEDALQEVFLVVHRRLGEYDPTRAKVTTWLFGIAARVAAGFRRRQRRLPQLTEADEAPGVSAPVDLEQRRKLQAIQDAIGMLDPEQRATFVLFEIDQMSCAQIAEVSGVPIGTVYSRLHLARRRLRKALSRAGLQTPEGKP